MTEPSTGTTAPSTETTAPPAPFDLADLNEQYAQAEKPEQGNFDEVPDGKYQVRVEKVEPAISQSGNRMLKWQLRVISGAQTNRMVFRQNILETAENMKYLKGDLSVCGVELEQVSDLPAHLGELLDVTLEVTKKTAGEFSNVYLNKRIVVDKQGAVLAGAAGSATAPCPF